MTEPYIVNYAKFTETKLIDSNNKFIGKVPIRVAKEMAISSGLDLVCFSEPEKGELALCKIIDYGKWHYHQEKHKKKEMNAKPEVKEVRFSPVIGEHDISHKVKQIIGFLEDGHEVIITMRFKGIHHRLMDEGNRIINQILEMCSSKGKEVHRKKTDDNICVRIAKV